MEQINNSQFHIQSSHVLKASSRTLIAVDTWPPHLIVMELS
jgi:hypothetical protein